MGGFLKWGYPNRWMVYFMDNPIQLDDDWGYPHFRKPPLVFNRMILQAPAPRRQRQLQLNDGRYRPPPSDWRKWLRRCSGHEGFPAWFVLGKPAR